MSLFKRPSWAQKNSAKSETPDPTTTTATTTTTNPPPANLFSRSENFDNVVAERERKKREKASKKKVKDEKKAAGGARDGGGSRRSLSDIQLDDDDSSSPEPKSGKRRRISNQEDEQDTSALGSRRVGGDGGGGRTRKAASPVTAALEDERQISHRYDRIPAPAKPATTRATRRTEPAVITLDSGDDSEDDLGQVPSPTQQSFDSPPRQTTAQTTSSAYNRLEEDDSESDPELAQIRRTVRENARLQEEAEAERMNASTRSFGGNDYADAYSAAALPHDPKIQILVTSPIPNTTPLIVSRKLSQRLQEVKDAWYSRQTLDMPKQSIFFTFRLRKLYDVTTGKSLGIKVDGAGKIIPDDRSYLDEDETGIGGQHEGKVHLEAMTEDLLRKMKEERRNGRTGSSAMHNRAGTERLGAEGTPVADGGAEETVLKINLKAKGFKDVKLKVKPVCLSRFAALVAASLLGERILIFYPEHNLFQNQFCCKTHV